MSASMSRRLGVYVWWKEGGLDTHSPSPHSNVVITVS